MNWQNAKLFKIVSGEKPTTPRGWVRVSRLITGVGDIKQVRELSSVAINPGIASEFASWCKLRDELDVEAYFKTPAKIKDKGIDVQYALMSAIADYVQRHKEKETLVKVLKVQEQLPAEMGRLCLRFIKMNDAEWFMKNMLAIPEGVKSLEAMRKYF